MTRVIGVRFRSAGKIYYFSPGKYMIKKGDHVIVETARGVEYGTVVSEPKDVEDDQVIKPLKTVLRTASSKEVTARGAYCCTQCGEGRKVRLSGLKAGSAEQSRAPCLAGSP